MLQPFKKAVRMFKKLNCTDPKLVSHSVIGKSFTVNGTGPFIVQNNKRSDVRSVTQQVTARSRRGKSKTKPKTKANS